MTKIVVFFNKSISILVLLTIISCNTPPYETKKIFRYNESKGIPTLDPAFARNQPVMFAVNHLYNGLVQINDSMQIMPAIAYKWEILENGKLYRFYLRNDVFFHDNKVFINNTGRKVTAYDFEYSFTRIIAPQTASPGSWIFSKVDTTFYQYNKGFKAINDSIFEIRLKTAFPPFLGILTMQYCSVLPHEAIDFYGHNFRCNPVGTGPFMFKFWKEGEKLILVKNPHYFETDSMSNPLPYLDAVNISFIPDKQSEFMEFMVGRLHYIQGITAAFKDEILTPDGNLNPKFKSKITLSKSPYLNTEYIVLPNDSNLEVMKGSSLKNLYVRRALNLAINRPKMMAYLRNNVGKAANSGIVPMGMPSFNADKVKGYSYLPDSAEKLLALAGYSKGKGLKPFSLTTTSDYVDICEFLQFEWSKIGIKCNIELATGATFRDMVANSKLESFRASWVADYPDAENYLALFYSPNRCPKGPNSSCFNSKKFDELFESACVQKSYSKRLELYQKMDSIIIHNATIIPLFYDEAIRLTHQNIEGLGINPLNLLSLKFVNFKK